MPGRRTPPPPLRRPIPELPGPPETAPLNVPFDEILAWLRAWALPPLMGAVIGYATNFVAIRMLFRPLRPKRVLGIQVPFTPGVIPRQRGQLARSIASVVARELLTADAIRGHLQRPDFAVRLREQLAALTAELLGMPVRKLARAVQGARPQIERGVTMLLHRLFRSRDFIYALRGLVGRAVETAGSRTLGEVAADLTLTDLVGRRLIPRLSDPEVGRRIGRAVNDAAARPGASLGDLLSPALVERITALLPAIAPPLMRELIGWLRRPAMRGELETRGRLLLSDALDRLNLMQTLFIRAAQYDRQLRERMPEIIDDALHQLEQTAGDPEVTAHMQEALSEWLGAARERPLADVLPDSAEQRIAELWGSLAAGPLAAIADTVLRRFLQEHGRTPVAELAARYLGVSVSDTVDEVSKRLLRYLSDEQAARSVASQVAAAVDRLAESGDVTLAELLAVDDGAKAALDGAVAGRAERMLVQQVPAMVAALDVERLVIDRIDRLEVRDVERILLTVIARHLKWINLFGALIGALIGLSQLALRGAGAAGAGL